MLVGGVLVAVLAIVAVLVTSSGSKSGTGTTAGTPGGTCCVSRTTVASAATSSTTGFPAASATTDQPASTPAASSAAQVAGQVQTILQASSDARALVTDALRSANCDTRTSSAATLQQASAQRTQQQTRADSLDWSVLPGGPAAQASFDRAMQDSAQSDSDLAQWLDESGDYCAANGALPDSASDSNRAQGNSLSTAATSEKTSFAQLWDYIAAQYGLTSTWSATSI